MRKITIFEIIIKNNLVLNLLQFLISVNSATKKIEALSISKIMMQIFMILTASPKFKKITIKKESYRRIK
jgi:hypothetical protein